MIMKTKICANPECNSSFVYKNPKKRFCNLYCKNQAAYLYKLEHYIWEVAKQKARQKNIQILEYLMKNNFTKATSGELKKLGFDFNAAYMSDQDLQKRTVYRYGNIQMVLLSPTEVELVYINKNR